MIDVDDIDGDHLDIKELLEKYDGILLDFFRGSW
jgi:hypothetical protein